MNCGCIGLPACGSCAGLPSLATVLSWSLRISSRKSASSLPSSSGSNASMVGGDVARHADLDRMAPAQRARIGIDLDDPRMLGIELAPREPAAEQHQRVAAQDRFVTAL